MNFNRSGKKNEMRNRFCLTNWNINWLFLSKSLSKFIVRDSKNMSDVRLVGIRRLSEQSVEEKVYFLDF